MDLPTAPVSVYAHGVRSCGDATILSSLFTMKKLVLDLDETLLFSSSERLHESAVELHAGKTAFYTQFRPGLRPFLEFAKKTFECYVWTTGQQAYLDAVWEYLDMPGFTLWGRQHCKKIENSDAVEPYEKPLRQITEDLTQIAILDNTPSMFSKCPLNGILMRTWRGDPDDTELTHLQAYLGWLATQGSMQRDHSMWRIETLCIRSR